MNKQLLLGDEALAQGALDAGLSGVYAYPGTPSTEITEYIQAAPEARERKVHNRWSANEKTAMEAALGMSFAGKRALVCMKHVGMNVAADCFVNAAITGVRGGLIVVAADDPGMHSSQNEQDSRFYGDFALIPMYEPSNQQEAYDMAYHGFDFSEQTGEPVLMRLVTRLAHSRSGVIRHEPQTVPALPAVSDASQFVLLPGIARRRYHALLEKQTDLLKASEESPYNQYTDGPDKSLGIIACGIGYNYLMENYPDGCPYPVLKIGQYPLPRRQLTRIATECDSLLVIEDGQPFVEKFLVSANKGEPAKPMAKIASGGELSRIMLAIKTVLSGKDKVDTLIFDEVDTGISGAAANKVGQKLKQVSRDRQVLCITHLAQIAALADHHLRISKHVKGDRTYTQVEPLDLEGRKEELARIIGGDQVTQLQLDMAEELIKKA